MITDTRQSPAHDGSSCTQTGQMGQYTLRQILGIWALVALAIGLIIWVTLPAIVPYSSLRVVALPTLVLVLATLLRLVNSYDGPARRIGTECTGRNSDGPEYFEQNF